MKLIENVSAVIMQSRSVSRRGFLQGALASGVFVLSARFVPEPLWAAEGEAAAAPFEPSLWMSIASDGTVTIVAHRSEMGCGSRTALPLVVADELDADWSKVKIEQAIGDPKYGEQDTDGSHSVRSNFDLMRQVGATGRAMLISAAAAQWDVSAKECATEPHFVVHKASGRKLGYGEVAAAAAKLPVPKKEDVPLKDALASGATSAKRAIPCSTFPRSSPAKRSSAWTRPCPVWSTRRLSIRRCWDRRSNPTTTRPRSKCRAFRRR